MHRRVLHALLSRRARRGYALAGLMIVAVATVFSGMAVLLAGEAPNWWRTVRRDDPATIETAESVEEALTTLFTRARRADPGYSPDSGEPWRSETWSFRIRASEVNAWLNVRLRPWLENQEEGFVWPREVSQVQVDFARGSIRVGACLRVGDREQILSASLTPRVDEDGSLSTPAEWVYVGRLAIPASWALEAADEHAAPYVPQAIRDLPEAQLMLNALLGVEPASAEPLINVGPGRKVRILAVEPKNGDLIVRCRTETH